MRKLIYLPLEPYVERYTWFMSCVDGWAEDNFKKFDVPFMRVEGEKLGESIEAGVVLDAHGRSYYAMSQMCKVVKMLKDGLINNDDIVYTEDFWHPGIESLFYIRALTGVDFRIGTFLHAQTVDEDDFTYPMRWWMRPIEMGYGRGIDYIFVTSAILKDLCVEEGIVVPGSIHVVGLPYNSHRLMNQLGELGFSETPLKEPYVLFSSRFDKEKNPHFFLDLVEQCQDIQFKLVKPRKSISNDPDVVKRLNNYLSSHSNLELVDTQNKLDYYKLLAHAEVQFNCAHQDWVSWTLLEAITFKCKPLYPIWRDFPLELSGFPDHLYVKDNLFDCEKQLRNLFEFPFDSDLHMVVRKHDKTWEHFLERMELL